MKDKDEVCVCGHTSHTGRWFGIGTTNEVWHPTACTHRTDTERWLAVDGSCGCKRFSKRVEIEA